MATRSFVLLGEPRVSEPRLRVLDPLSNLLSFSPVVNKRVDVPADNSGEIVRLDPGLFRLVVKNAGPVLFFLSFSGVAGPKDYPVGPGEVLDLPVDARSGPYKLFGYGDGAVATVHVLAFRFSEEMPQ